MSLSFEAKLMKSDLGLASVRVTKDAKEEFLRNEWALLSAAAREGPVSRAYVRCPVPAQVKLPDSSPLDAALHLDLEVLDAAMIYRSSNRLMLLGTVTLAL